MSEALLFDKRWRFHDGFAASLNRKSFRPSLFSSLHVSYVPWASVCMHVVSLTRFLWFGSYPASSAFSLQSTPKQSVWFARILPAYFMGLKKDQQQVFFHRWERHGRQWHTNITSICHRKRSDASQEDPRRRLWRHLQRRLCQTESQDAESWRGRQEGEGKKNTSSDDCSVLFFSILNSIY